MNFYDGDGRRTPFDPAVLRAALSGCLLCGRRVAMVGVFAPATEAAKAAVLRLRRNAIPPGTAIAMAYGLCTRHDVATIELEVEAQIFAMAKQVRVQ